MLSPEPQPTICRQDDAALRGDLFGSRPIAIAQIINQDRATRLHPALRRLKVPRPNSRLMRNHGPATVNKREVHLSHNGWILHRDLLKVRVHKGHTLLHVVPRKQFPTVMVNRVRRINMRVLAECRRRYRKSALISSRLDHDGWLRVFEELPHHAERVL